MPTGLFLFNSALQRLISWSGSGPVPDLPSELIFQEVLPHLRDDAPTSLADLRVALTCKAFYHALYPLIARFFVDRLVEAYAGAAKLDLSLIHSPNIPSMGIQEFSNKVVATLARSSLHSPEDPTSQDVGAFDSPFQMTYYAHLGIFNDTDLLWALTHLLSKPNVSKYLHSLRVVLVENSSLQTNAGDRPLAVVNASDGWKRAFLKLIDSAVEREGAELHLTSVPGFKSLQKASLGSAPSPFVPFLGSRLHKLSSTSEALNLFWHGHLNSLIKQSSRTLTHLHIGGWSTPEAQWRSMLPKWHLPVLENFEMDAIAIPLADLISFLLLNPSISSATLLMSPPYIHPGTKVPGLLPKDYPRFLPQLRTLAATTDLLLALFTPWPDASHPDIPLHNLETLTIVHRFTIDYDDMSGVLLYAPGSREQSRTSLRAIVIELPNVQTDDVELCRWLGSVSPAIQLIDDISISFDGLTLSTAKPGPGVVMPLTRPDLTAILSSLTEISSFSLRVVVPKFIPSSRLLRRHRRFSLDPHTIICFMAALPAAKEVVLDGVFRHPRAAVKDEVEFWTALASMWLACSALERLEVKGIGDSTISAIWNVGDDGPSPGFDTWSHAFTDATVG